MLDQVTKDVAKINVIRQSLGNQRGNNDIHTQ